MQPSGGPVGNFTVGRGVTFDSTVLKVKEEDPEPGADDDPPGGEVSGSLRKDGIPA